LAHKQNMVNYPMQDLQKTLTAKPMHCRNVLKKSYL